MPMSAARSDPARVHYGADVVHAILQAGNVNGPVAQPRADLVERDHAGEAGQSFEPRGGGRPVLRIERPVEVRDESRDEHDVDRTVADHRVCDV